MMRTTSWKSHLLIGSALSIGNMGSFASIGSVPSAASVFGVLA